MGRVAKAGSSNSGKAGKNDIGKTRTKRRKRRDLEELHRNVLEAKRNLRQRGLPKEKRKTTLEKVLNNFADKRQETNDVCQNIAEKKHQKKKPKTICNRLLPKMILGIYQNGTKGHRVNRENRKLNEINEARLQDDVLKLLNGDETNPKFLWNGDKKLAENGKKSKALSSDDSDCEASIGSRVSCNKTPITGKTKSVKRINEDYKKINSIGEKQLVAKKNEQQQFSQRENNCRRRSFKLNEDQTDSNRLGDAANSSDFVMGEIRFSPSSGNARDVSPPEDCFRKKKHAEFKEIETRKKKSETLMPIETTTGTNIWGRSPSIYYERLCAMVCAENFENNRGEHPSGSDPLVKIQSTLRKFYQNARAERGWGRKTVIAKGNKRREQTLSKVSVPLKDLSLPSTGEIQACITDSEIDQESSDSGVTKVGSWHRKHFGRISKPKNSSVVSKADEIFESNIHNKETRSNDNIAALKNEKNNYFEDKNSSSIEKTIHSVALFLEKLREKNGKANIVDEKGAAHFFIQGQYSSDNSTEKPRHDSTFDINQRNFVRRNTKHVPTILRRSNSRCGVSEGVDEKYQPLPPSNWLFNGPRRSTRTFAALPRRSQTKTEKSDYLETPRIVNELSVINKTKANILKTKLNLMKAKYRPDTKFLSSEYEEFENSLKKHAKNVHKNRKQSASQFFANSKTADHHERYSTDFRVSSQDTTSENRPEGDRKSRRVNFGTHDNLNEPSVSQVEKCFPDDIFDFHHHENSQNHMQTKLNFEFPCPEVTKNVDSRERQIFANEMENVSLQRLPRDHSHETFIRPRYISENLKASTRGSQISDLVSASRCGDDIQFLPETYVEHIPIPSETKGEMKNRSFKPLPSYHANTLSVDRLAMNAAAGCAEHCREVALRQRIRKPVMVFRPIQETRQQQETRDSCCRLAENEEGTINDAVRNFRVLTCNDKNKNHCFSQHQPPEIYDLHYHAHQHQEQQQKSLSQLHCHQQLIHKKHNKSVDNHPTKYLAYDKSDGMNPRRLPIFVKTDDNQVANESAVSYTHDIATTKLFKAFATPEKTEIMCLSCHDGKNPRLPATKVQCYEQQHQRPGMGPRRTSELTLMLPCSASFCQGAPTNNTKTTPTSHGPTSIKDIPRVVYNMKSCETLVPLEMTYEPLLCAQSRYDNEKLSKRVQLPDGTVGILVTENRSINNAECLGNEAGACSRFKRNDIGNINERNLSGLANERMYY